MNTDNSYLNTNNSPEEDIQSLTSIYRQISIEFNDCYDEVEENKLLNKHIDNCFTIEFKHIDNLELIKDVTLFNSKFVEFIKYCQANKFTKVYLMFITFCDYFDLPYNIMFINLHPKVKNIILSKYINLIGDEEYQKQKIKYEEPKDYTQPTLFDLIK